MVQADTGLQDPARLVVLYRTSSQIRPPKQVCRRFVQLGEQALNGQNFAFFKLKAHRIGHAPRRGTESSDKWHPFSLDQRRLIKML